MDIYALIFCPEVGDFFLCKKEDIDKEYDRQAKYIGKTSSFVFYDISKDGSIYIYDEDIIEDDLILVKDDKEIQQVVELFIYTCDKGWGNQTQRANFKGSIYDGLLYFYNHRSELCKKHKNDS